MACSASYSSVPMLASDFRLLRSASGLFRAAHLTGYRWFLRLQVQSEIEIPLELTVLFLAGLIFIAGLMVWRL